MLNRKYHGANVHSIKLQVNSMGSSGEKLIIEAIAKNKIRSKQRNIDQTYVIFDKDEHTKQQLERCLKLAKQHNIKIMFSNISFEIWILLHFEMVSRTYTNEELVSRLSRKEFFDCDYHKFKGNNYSGYLIDRVKQAKLNADELFQKNNNWLKDEPFTNIQEYLAEIYGVDTF
ncbi:RloB family protein [Companilactobacillus allii]|nr:RloB family protein [Companilactobacillus allii]